MDSWISIVRDFGVAVVCLFGLALAVWKTARWTAEHVILPITTAHLGLVNKVMEAVDKMEDNSEKQTQALVHMGQDLREVHSLVIHTQTVAIQGPTSTSTPATTPNPPNQKT